MKVSVIGCGRWGSLIAWYLDHIGHSVTLYGEAISPHTQRFLKERRNDLLEMPLSVDITTDITKAFQNKIIVISISSQNLDDLTKEIASHNVKDKVFVLCMKGIEISTGRRLSQIAEENLDSSNSVAVWLGPGHVEEFYKGNPSCMVIDSRSEALKKLLVDEFSSDLIRFYYGNDIIGNELGAALKNVVGIAAGLLDGMELTTLKGALMARGAYEVGKFIKVLGGDEFSAYGLCHLGDYEATLFSPHSHNRMFGEAWAKGEKYEQLAEGYYTVKAVKKIADERGIEMPICDAVYKILYEGRDAKKELNALFQRELRSEK